MASRLSIRVLAAVIAVIPAFAVAVALGWLASSSSRRVAEDLAKTLVESASQRVSAEVGEFLGDAVRLSEVYARRIENGALPARAMDRDEWLKQMFDDLGLFPGVASICFANGGGEAVWLLRDPGGLQYGLSGGGGDLMASEVRVLPDGRADTALLRPAYVYEPAKRVWHQMAVAPERQGKPVWTPAYFWFGNSGQAATTGAGYTRVVSGPGGARAGVLVIDVTLEGLSEFLRRLPVSEAGAVFIIDEQGKFIAASGGRVTGDDGQRVDLAGNGLALAPVAMGAQSESGNGEVRRIGAGELASRVQVRPLRPYAGIDWTVITVLPESAFMAEARSVQRRATMFAAIATLGGVLLAAAFSRLLARPIESLSRHVRKIGTGDFESRVNLRASQEFVQLSEDVNAMQRGLKERMELERSLEVAMAVQQSLLPLGDPSTQDLDVAGRSRYCDATGGDYYDFLEIGSASEHAMLIAVGDVMGHGIGSALLMASARAALRVQAMDIGALGRMLERINAVLAQGRHNRFMTLALVVIDTERRQLRWASAGHDPALVYRAKTGDIEELDDGDLPLGVDSTADFREFLRTGLHAGDVVLVGTDGIWETRNPTGELFGKDRLRAILRTHHAAGAARIAAEIEREVGEFRGAGPQEDDVTFVVAVVRAAWE